MTVIPVLLPHFIIAAWKVTGPGLEPRPFWNCTRCSTIELSGPPGYRNVTGFPIPSFMQVVILPRPWQKASSALDSEWIKFAFFGPTNDFSNWYAWKSWYRNTRYCTNAVKNAPGLRAEVLRTKYNFGGPIITRTQIWLIRSQDWRYDEKGFFCNLKNLHGHYRMY